MNEELKVIISAEVSKLKQNIDKAKKEVQSFKDKVKEASKNVDEKFKSMGTSITNGLKSVATGVTAAGAALLALGASTQEYRNQQAQLATAFEQAGGSAEQAKGVYNELYKILGDGGRATEAAQHLAKLTTDEEGLAATTDNLIGVYATFGDSLPLEGLAEGINHTAKLGEVQGALADALEWGGVNVDEFNSELAKCSSEQERAYLINERLTDLYYDAGQAYLENNKQVIAQNEAQAKLQETTAKLGEAVAPVVTAFTQFAGEALAVVLPYIQQLAENFMPTLSELLGTVAEKLGEAFNWVSQHKEVLAVMAGIITGIVTAIGLYNTVAAIKQAMAVAEVTSVWALVSAYAAQAVAMAAALAPYLLIVAAIAAVIAIIVLCVKHWDEIKEAVAKAWDWIKEKTSQAVEAVVEWFNKLKAKIKVHIDNIKQNITTIFSNIKETIVAYIQMACDIVLSIFDGIKNGIKNRLDTLKGIITNVIALIKAIFTGDMGAAKDALLGIFDSIKTGISNSLNNAKTTVKNVIDAIKGFFNFTWSLPKLKMPSIKITGKFSLSPLSVPKFSISWHKLGGVFDKPTLFNYGGSLHGMGEDGAEAVVPLERNTQWLDRLATMLNEKQGNTPIVMQVDGKTFAEVACASINQLTKQRGALALNII